MGKIMFWTLLIIVVATLTGSWIFGLLGDFFNLLVKGCRFMEKIFNFFGWNKGILNVTWGWLC